MKKDHFNTERRGMNACIWDLVCHSGRKNNLVTYNSTSMLVTPWLEHTTCVTEVVGSIPTCASEIRSCSFRHSQAFIDRHKLQVIAYPQTMDMNIISFKLKFLMYSTFSPWLGWEEMFARSARSEKIEDRTFCSDSIWPLWQSYNDSSRKTVNTSC